MRSSAVVLALLAGCAGGPVRYAAPDLPSRLPAAVAVLPFDNEAVSLRAPVLVRGLVREALARRGWSTAESAAVDSALAGLGVTDGGQLRALDPAKLGRAVGCDGLLYGTVEEFAYQNVGFLRRRTVRVRLRLVEAASGERLWEAVGDSARGKLAVRKGEAGRSFVEGVIEQAAESALGAPLLEESRAAVEKALSRLYGRMR